jgi:hypothetical protein
MTPVLSPVSNYSLTVAEPRSKSTEIEPDPRANQI